MKLSQLRIQNFRSFEDETIDIDGYTCLVGPNGAGKSTVLAALNVFFRNSSSSPTSVTSLSEEDFHHRNTLEPIKITLTFEDLSPEAQTGFAHYYRHDRLIVSAQASWDATFQRADVKQYGSRLVMDAFAPFFECVEKKVKADDRRKVYEQIRKAFPELPSVSSAAGAETALRQYEENHPEMCSLKDSPNEFYGFTKGSDILAKYVQWVYVPAVKDASAEQLESSKTALGQLLDRTLRSQISFQDDLDSLKQEATEKYRSIIGTRQEALQGIQDRLEMRLREWTNPASNLDIRWECDPDKSIVVNEPIARLRLGEHSFLGDVARLGHGMQRALIVTLLQELASISQETSPRLILGIEEPELYQHPPQAQHMAQLLESIAGRAQSNSQVVITTHSPYFVSSRGFESVRMFSNNSASRSSKVTCTTFARVQGTLTEALHDTATMPSPASIMASIEQIMQPSQRELFFCSTAVLVEGTEDIAYVSTYLHLLQQWDVFRRLGCHFVTAEGKTSLSRLLAIALELQIPAFLVFDADTDRQKPEQIACNRRDNCCLLRLCGMCNADPLPQTTLYGDNLVMWKTNIGKEVRDSYGDSQWNEAERNARELTGLSGARRKNSILIAATLEELWRDNSRSSALQELCNAILSFAQKNEHLIRISP